jgi:hypothetical protein
MDSIKGISSYEYNGTHTMASPKAEAEIKEPQGDSVEITKGRGGSAGPQKPKTALTEARSADSAEETAVAPVKGEHFAIEMGNSRNYFFRSPDVSSQIVIYEKPQTRLLACFPEGNTAAFIEFGQHHPENKGLRLTLNGEPSSFSDADNHRGVSMDLSTNKTKIVLDCLELDSIRAIRDMGTPGYDDRMKNRNEYLESRPESIALFMPSLAIETREGTQCVTVSRKTPDGKNEYKATLRLAGNVRATISDGGTIALESVNKNPVSFKMRASTDYEKLNPIFSDDILNEEGDEYRQKLRERASLPGATEEDKSNSRRYEDYLRNLSFLSYKEKFLAGGWRYLTYFGRDTMLSLMMLKSSVKPNVYLAGIRSVLDRMSADGSVAHEEDIGFQAYDDHIRAHERQKKKEVAAKGAQSLMDDVYDYKMVDDDFLFPILLDMYMNDKSVPEKKKVNFLNNLTAGKEKNSAAVLRNWNFTLTRAKDLRRISVRKGEPYPDAAKGFITIRKNEQVGDWRDSNIGLGGGIQPGSVNVDLVANSLKSIDGMIKSGIMGLSSLKEIAEKENLPVLQDILKSYSPDLKSRKMETMIGTWEKAKDAYKIKLTADDVKERVKNYLDEYPLDNEEKSMLLATEIEKGCSVKDFVDGGKVPATLRDGLSFSALSLDKNGRKVEVMNSDSSFRLMTGEPSPGEIRDILKTVTLPYPIGLKNDLGIFVANPIYSKDRQLWKAMDKDGYHGTVVWSWQVALMEKGLMKQIERFSKESGRRDPEAQELVRKMKDALRSIHQTQGNVGDMVNFELWTYKVDNGKMKPQHYGQNASSETESNAIQLWSTVGLSVMQDYDRIQDRA